MPGVVFLIVVPTANFERELVYGTNYEVPPPIPPHQQPLAVSSGGGGGNNNLNINLSESSSGGGGGAGNANPVLRLEVQLRDKNAPKFRRGAGRGAALAAGRGGRGGGGVGVGPAGGRQPAVEAAPPNIVVPLEKVLEELLAKLEIDHVTWTTSRKGFFHHVVFPAQAGEQCETTLHCLTELGIGTKLNSSVSVLPCSVSYDALNAPPPQDDFSDEAQEDLSKWKGFVESITSKLTVKQVVDGVRSGGSLSFDYLLLIVTADSLAALGLVENNASNIVAAMLVSPLMGPVMSITFGTIISDRELMRVGFISLALGMFISCLFGFVFGLILGTTEMPWGSGDWPTEEMRGRGNVRSLWMGVLWALTSGTGVAVALLQGSAGPLIGVAISASLLPPVVNCGLFWALACIWLIYPGTRIPHLQGEPYDGNSSYPFLYTNYLPTEFLINGIVSGLLTVVNVICIFITAIIVLKIKEVSAPYTASPDLKRFWETDLRTVRKTNRSTMRHRKATFREKLLPNYQGLEEPRSRELDTVLEQALKEAEDDVTFNKVKRMSYSSNAAGELTQRLAKLAGITNNHSGSQDAAAGSGSGSAHGLGLGSRTASRMNSMRNSKAHADLSALDKLVSSLLEQHSAKAAGGDGEASGSGTGSGAASGGGGARRGSSKLSRWRPTSRSAHSFVAAGPGSDPAVEHGTLQHATQMPTIMESGTGGGGVVSGQRGGHASWTASLERTPGNVRNVLQSIANAPQRFSQSLTGSGGGDAGASDDENLNLTKNPVE